MEEAAQRLTLQEGRTRQRQPGSGHILCTLHIPSKSIPHANDAVHLGGLASFVVKH